MKDAIKLLERWLKEWKTDSCDENERLMTDTMRFIRRKNLERFSTEKEEMLDRYLHEFVMTFVPETSVEKTIYANAAHLVNEHLDPELRKLVSDKIRKFMLKDSRNGHTS